MKTKITGITREGQDSFDYSIQYFGGVEYGFDFWAKALASAGYSRTQIVGDLIENVHDAGRIPVGVSFKIINTEKIGNDTIVGVFEKTNFVVNNSGTAPVPEGLLSEFGGLLKTEGGDALLID